MGKDLQKKGYLYASERFADLINGVVCGGKKILLPSDLTKMDSQTGYLRASTGRKRRGPRKRPRYRDVIRKAAFGINFMVIGVENQEEVTGVFQTDLKQVFDCIRCADDPDKLYELITSDPVYQELEEETYDVIAEHIKTVELF